MSAVDAAQMLLRMGPHNTWIELINPRIQFLIFNVLQLESEIRVSRIVANQGECLWKI